MILNRHLFDFYIENYKNIKVNITPSVNQSGVLQVNEKNDSLYGQLNTGTFTFNKLVGYSSQYYNKLLLFQKLPNGTLYSKALISDFITDNKFSYTVNPMLPLQYRINAKQDLISNSNDSPDFAIALTGRTVFSVELNDKPLVPSQYKASSVKVTINDTSILNPYENEIRVIHYATAQTITDSFYLGYEGVEKVYDLDSATCDYTFFEDKIKIDLFGDFSTNINKTLSETKNTVERVSRKLETDRVSTMSIAFYTDGQDITDLLNNKFRVLAYDPYSDVLYYYSNCRITAGVPRSYSSGGNQITVEIEFENEIKVYGTFSTPVAYGEGIYGVGYYGGGVSVVTN